MYPIKLGLDTVSSGPMIAAVMRLANLLNSWSYFIAAFPMVYHILVSYCYYNKLPKT